MGIRVVSILEERPLICTGCTGRCSVFADPKFDEEDKKALLLEQLTLT